MGFPVFKNQRGRVALVAGDNGRGAMNETGPTAPIVDDNAAGDSALVDRRQGRFQLGQGLAPVAELVLEPAGIWAEVQSWSGTKNTGS